MSAIGSEWNSLRSGTTLFKIRNETPHQSLKHHNSGLLFMSLIVSIASLLVSVLTLVTRSGIPIEVRIITLAIPAILVLILATKQFGFMDKFKKWFKSRKKLSSHHRTRLKRLCEDGSKLLNNSYSYSPIHLWYDAKSNGLSNQSVSYSYCLSIQTWYEAQKDALFVNERSYQTALPTMSEVIRHFCILAGQIQDDVQNVLQLEELIDHEKKSLKSDWYDASQVFNQWANDFESLVKEVNNENSLQCNYYFERLKPLEY